MKIIEALKFSIKSCLLKVKYRKPKVLNSIDTINYILENNCSIARFGDGELSLMEGRNIKFQPFNSQLADKLKRVCTNDKCLVCVPNVFEKKSLKGICNSEKKFWKRSNFVFGGMWNKYFSHNSILGDAFISRFYMRYKDKSNVGAYVDNLKKLWDNKNIVFVEGENSRLGVGNDLFDNASSVRRILCPSINAFEQYDEIVSSIKSNCKKDDLIIVALGPTASILCYEMSGDYQMLDLGHIDIEYEWFCCGATTKIPVKNKHVNECNSMGECDESELDKKYLEEIIAKIGIEN